MFLRKMKVYLKNVHKIMYGGLLTKSYLMLTLLLLTV